MLVYRNKLLWLRCFALRKTRICSASVCSLGRRLERIAEQVTRVAAGRRVATWRTAAGRHTAWRHSAGRRTIGSNTTWRHAVRWWHSTWGRTLRSWTAWLHSIGRTAGTAHVGAWATHRRTIWSLLVRIHLLVGWWHSLARRTL
jgi:hypothetical protein